MRYCTRNPTIKKPELSDAASIIDINDNMDVIDGIICKNNFNGVIDPSVNDDVGDGYSVGSNWWNVTGHKLFVAESVATGAAVWRQIYPASGWIDAPALTFSAADAPVYTVTCNGDYTLIIPVGARIALAHSGATKYFIVVKTSYSSPNTTFTLYGGTDYTLAAGAITNPYYSIAKAPVGFPLDPAKWTVLLTDSTDRHQSNPVKDTIYNPGSLSISLPIGIWNISFQAILVCAASSGTLTDVYGGLSTSLTAFNNQALRGRGYLGGPTAGVFIGLLYRSTVLNIASKTTYYVLCMTDLDNQSVIGFNNASDASLDVRAVCAYL